MCLCIHAYAWWLFQMYVWIRVDPIYEFKHACISEWDKFQAWTIHLVNAPWYWITRLLYRKMPNIFFNGKNRKKYIVCNSRKKKNKYKVLRHNPPWNTLIPMWHIVAKKTSKWHQKRHLRPGDPYSCSCHKSKQAHKHFTLLLIRTHAATLSFDSYILYQSHTFWPSIRHLYIH